MRVGCCLPLNTLMPEFRNRTEKGSVFPALTTGYDTVMKMGYAYLEATCGAVMDLSEEELKILSEKTKDGSFAVPYVNCFLPVGLQVCTQIERAKEYAAEAFRRLSMLKVQALVFGSGKSRSFPADMDPETGRKIFTEYLTYCAELGERYGIYTCLEPLQATETNQINLVSQAVETVRKLGLPFLKVTPDAFHMCVGGETADALKGNLSYVHHIHISEAPGRVYPGKLGGQYLIPFAARLKEIGYDGDLTVECGYDDFLADMRAAYTFIKEKLL